MDKIEIKTSFVGYPMPVVLVGSLTDGRPNFMTAAWITHVNYAPPLIAVAIGKAHHTRKGISEYRQFSVNIPGRDMVEIVDYCGLISGSKVDKSDLFETFSGKLDHAPMIAQCPLTMECTVVQSVELQADMLFIGEIKGAYADEQYMTEGAPDLRKIEPFVLTMPDNNYWSLGEVVGRAWQIGKDHRP